MPQDIELIHFRYSHYNEKVRWALDWKGLPHRRIAKLPGPHMPYVKRLTGQTSTPVLKLDGTHVAGSAAIIDRLEARYPQRPLYPQDSDARRRSLELQTWLDAELGPYVRRAMFSMILDEGSYVCDMFSAGRPWPQRLLYRLTFPLAKGLIKRGNGVTSQQAIDEAFGRTRAVFDELHAGIGAAGYLVGDSFSVADLTAAALSAAAFNPPDSPMTRPEPLLARPLA